jgi:AcrR family transcriptional regulator
MFPPSAMAEPEVPLGRRARKTTETRAALADAAMRLFAENGYDNTTIEDITDVVDISSRTFFRYFSSKEDVLFTDVDHEPFVEQIRAQPLNVSDVDAVRNAYIAMLPSKDPAVDERTILLKKALESTPTLQGRNLQLQSDFRLVIARALADRRGLAEPDDTVRLAAAIAQAVMHLAFDRWAAADGRTDVRDELRTFFALAVTAVSPQS